MNLSHPSQLFLTREAFSDGAALALARVKSSRSPAGAERISSLAAEAGHCLREITGLISVRHGRLVRPAWHISTDFGSHYVILINETEAELYDSKTDLLIARAPASAAAHHWATSDILAQVSG
jgi:hypothetical protein